ncbi:hydroxymethylpyrimidine/phosphomethylpyrimidine kinase [Taibaiella helva]|uniref:hydroxymethylpyrimidine/phosphomethylpyrimidine kinase n=1 Tax=Taibaiella helva TaxID=2301235 RepID=UPI000E56812F|nr:hydroxymethylpyrimidine/phosphomethylpyrimidine kinase [Taibaiella helva]
MSYERPVVLSIAGYDPCGGAGVLADVKTFEQHHCLGMAAVTAWTVQTEEAFLHWCPVGTEQVLAQVQPLLERYPIEWIKIGLCPGPEGLLALLQGLKRLSPGVKVIWDPVLSATAGYAFVAEVREPFLAAILEQVYLVTPNVPEALLLSRCADDEAAALTLSRYTRVLLKGGHSESTPGMDRLWIAGARRDIPPTGKQVYAKHGSGCILSAAITANLAHGLILEAACVKGKQYVEQVLRSNTQLLAYHAT